MNRVKTKSPHWGLFFALITGLSWSVLAIALKVAADYASSGTIVWFRFLTALISLILFSIFFHKEGPSPLKIIFSPPLTLLVCGVLLGVNYYGFMKGVELTSASNTQVFIQLGPLSLAAIGLFYFKEKLSRIQLLGLLVASAGFIIFYTEQLSLFWQQRDIYTQGNLWIFLAAITWTFYATVQKKISSKYSATQINLIVYSTCTLLLLPLADLQQITLWSPGVLALMIALGLNTVLAYGSLSLALRWAPASQISLIIACNPLLTLLFLYLAEIWTLPWIKYEPLSPHAYLGALVVITGVVLTITRPRYFKNVSK